MCYVFLLYNATMVRPDFDSSPEALVRDLVLYNATSVSLDLVSSIEA